MKKYRAQVTTHYTNWQTWSKTITCVEADRETGPSVWIDGKRYAKKSEYVSFFDSFEDAKTALIMAQGEMIDRAYKRLESLKNDLAKLEGMEA
jgi:hypothetical protein